jgi:hypothetical protein
MAGRIGRRRRRCGGLPRWPAPGNSRSRSMRRPRASLASSLPGGVGAPPGGTTAPCQELADGTGLLPSCRWRRDPPPVKETAIAGGGNGEAVSEKRGPAPDVRTPRRSAERRRSPQGERPVTYGSRRLALRLPLHAEGKGKISPARGRTRAHPAPTKQHGRRSFGYLAAMSCAV